MKITDILRKFESVNLHDNLETIPYITDEPKIPAFLCIPNSLTKEKYETSKSFGQGYDLNITVAKVKAIGEFLERLAIDNPQEDQLIKGVFTKSKKFIDPILFCCYSSEQLKTMPNYEQDCLTSEFSWINSIEINSLYSYYL